MTIPTETHIPAPPRSRYPFKDMAIGASFAMPQGVSLPAFRCAASRAGARWGFRFTVRKTPEEIRCWRIQ